MSNIETGGPAFPTYEKIGTEVVNANGDEIDVFGSFGGMTMRDYFAAKAMIGLFGFWVAVNAKTSINDPDPKIVSEMAYEYADAMLKAREA